MLGELDEALTLACAESLEMRLQRIAPPADGIASGFGALVATQVPPVVIVERPAVACAWVTSYLLSMRPQSLSSAAPG